MLGNVISAQRKKLGLTQEQLAQRLDVTNQAVSKWETDQSCPDVAMLPKLADVLGISIDALFGRETAEKTTAELPWEDDDAFHVVLYCGHRLVGSTPANSYTFAYDGPARDIHCALNLQCGNVEGNVEADGYVECDNVGGSVYAGAYVECDDVAGHANAGAYIECDSIDGNVNANGYVECDDVAGSVNAGSYVECGDVGGNVTSMDYVECGNIGGTVHAEGDITSDHGSDDAEGQDKKGKKSVFEFSYNWKDHKKK